MRDTVPMTNVPLFPPEYRASGLLLHVTSLPSPMASAIWDRPPSHGLTVSTMRARDGGRRYRSARLVMETRHINRCRRLPATAC